MITINQMLFALTSRRFTGGNYPISEAIIDSRKVIPGALFIALEGENTDGHRYVSQAFKHGAVAGIVCKDIPDFDGDVIDIRDINDSQEQIPLPPAPFCIRAKDSLGALQQIAKFWRKQMDIRVVGITGSVGKSSTKELIAEVLSQKFHTFKNPGNYNNEIGLPLTILNMGCGYERLVLEMGFYYPGEITFLCEISRPDIGVVTNVGTVHAERAGSQEAIAKGKAELIAALPAKPAGTAILNYDDHFVRAMAKQTRAACLFYGIHKEADIWADEIQGLGLQGIRFRMHYHSQSIRMTVPILGRHSVQTILRASAVGLTEGMTMQEVAEGLMHGNSQLRLVAVRTDSGALILDDTYNATPESTIAALDLLSELKGQKIAVLGDMLELGQYEKAGHQEVGIKAAEVVNYLIAVGKRGKIIAESAKQRGLSPTAIACVDDAIAAVQLLKYNLRAEDVVLVKGSHGMRMDRISSMLEASK